MPNPVINPRLSQELADLLDAHEVSHEEGALLWELEKRGYWLYLSGPEDKLNPGFRWEVRIGDTKTDTRRTIQRGQTARIALARAFSWVVQEEERDDA